ncbi:hypothetical protein AMTR_s00165p00075610 [Amborella trichopoda]|uniref:Uncharacterized protein n=1 Tax=Amborella trichopoda TaxID=13333 RepID=W1PWA2_AMBTC|nr:hypothetical protein AMTR_s00165p00075610 [Amborella trichopoda]
MIYIYENDSIRLLVSLHLYTNRYDFPFPLDGDLAVPNASSRHLTFAGTAQAIPEDIAAIQAANS